MAEPERERVPPGPIMVAGEGGGNGFVTIPDAGRRGVAVEGAESDVGHDGNGNGFVGDAVDGPAVRRFGEIGERERWPRSDIMSVSLRLKRLPSDFFELAGGAGESGGRPVGSGCGARSSRTRQRFSRWNRSRQIR